MEVFVRMAVFSDVDDIDIILHQGKKFLNEQGLPQWQNGYGPSRTMIEQDITNQEGYVLLIDGNISGYAALIKKIDNSYADISEGQWDLKYDKYISIHRVAIRSENRGNGLSKYFLHELISIAGNIGYHDIRIDTYPLNHIMEKAILSSGFSYKGMICFPIPDGERKAYQLLT